MVEEYRPIFIGVTFASVGHGVLPDLPTTGGTTDSRAIELDDGIQQDHAVGRHRSGSRHAMLSQSDRPLSYK